MLVLAGFGGDGRRSHRVGAAATDVVAGAVNSTVQELDPTQSIRSDEHLLSGSTASKVEAAAMGEYPNATIQRVETDSEGVYEVRIVTAGGEEVIVLVGEDFTVTGTQSCANFGGHSDGDGFGPRHGDDDSDS